MKQSQYNEILLKLHSVTEGTACALLLECDICQGTSTAYIYDHELARSTENEIEKRAIKLAMEMVKNGEVR